MQTAPLSLLFGILVALLIASAFFSMSETAMMAANRFRLRHLAASGHRGARLALDLIGRTDRLLGVILLFNNLVNAAAATLVSVIAIELFGENEWALGVGTLTVTFAILIFSEISPKVVGASYADRLALIFAYLLTPLLRISYPLVWFVNLFVSGLLRTLRLPTRPTSGETRLTPEELRTIVLESSHYIPAKHKSILLNLFELETITVEDVMTPRASIEALDLAAPWDDLMTRLTTCYHTRLPVYREDPGGIVGILHMRRVIAPLQRGDLDLSEIEAQLQEPYYIPASTPVFAQLQFFQENRQRMGLVVDEYGEVLGIVTLEDILEEIIGEFTTSVPSGTAGLAWDSDGTALVEGERSLRDINRRLALGFPTDGPKTLNGLIIEHFQDIPEAGVSLMIARVPIEIVQTHDKRVKVARLGKPARSAAET